MKTFKILPAFLALVWAAVSCLGLFTTLGVLVICHERLGMFKPMQYRAWFTALQSWFSAVLLYGLCFVLRIEVVFDADEINLSHAWSIMMPSNHVWLGDPLFVYLALRKVGRKDITWVMKESLRRTPFGWAAGKMGAAFVTREGGDDFTKIRAAAKWAEEHGFVLSIYPEGTRRKVIPPGSEYKRLQKLRTGGVQTAAEELKEAPFLVLALHWSGGEDDLSPGRTWREFLTDIANLYGRTVTVRLRFTQRSEVGDPKLFLRHCWSQMDDWLVQQDAQPN